MEINGLGKFAKAICILFDINRRFNKKSSCYSY